METAATATDIDDNEKSDKVKNNVDDEKEQPQGTLVNVHEEAAAEGSGGFGEDEESPSTADAPTMVVKGPEHGTQKTENRGEEESSEFNTQFVGDEPESEHIAPQEDGIETTADSVSAILSQSGSSHVAATSPHKVSEHSLNRDNILTNDEYFNAIAGKDEGSTFTFRKLLRCIHHGKLYGSEDFIRSHPCDSLRRIMKPSTVKGAFGNLAVHGGSFVNRESFQSAVAVIANWKPAGDMGLKLQPPVKDIDSAASQRMAEALEVQALLEEEENRLKENQRRYEEEVQRRLVLEQQQFAAAKIQKVARGRQGRIKAQKHLFREKERSRQYVKASRQIQRVVRGHLGRCTVRDMRDDAERRERSATLLQARARGITGRTRVQMIKQRRRNQRMLAEESRRRRRIRAWQRKVKKQEEKKYKKPKRGASLSPEEVRFAADLAKARSRRYRSERAEMRRLQKQKETKKKRHILSALERLPGFSSPPPRSKLNEMDLDSRILSGSPSLSLPQIRETQQDKSTAGVSTVMIFRTDETCCLQTDTIVRKSIRANETLRIVSASGKGKLRMKATIRRPDASTGVYEATIFDSDSMFHLDGGRVEFGEQFSYPCGEYEFFRGGTQDASEMVVEFSLLSEFPRASLVAEHDDKPRLRENGKVHFWDLTSGADEPSIGRFKSLTRVSRISAGKNHCLALTVHGSLYSWGKQSSCLGHGRDATDVEQPRLVEDFRFRGAKITSIAAGSEHSLCTADVPIQEQGLYERRIFAWGKADERLGLGNQPRSGTVSLHAQERVTPSLFATEV
eukprot:g2214.t1